MKALIRLRVYAGWARPSLSAYARRHVSAWRDLFCNDVLCHWTLIQCVGRVVTWSLLFPRFSVFTYSRWAVTWTTTQQIHGVIQRRCNVMTLHRRWGAVVLTSCACWGVFGVNTTSLYNVGSTLMQDHDVASTLRRRCISAMCLLGCLRGKLQTIKIQIRQRGYIVWAATLLYVMFCGSRRFYM